VSRAWQIFHTIMSFAYFCLGAVYLPAGIAVYIIEKSWTEWSLLFLIIGACSFIVSFIYLIHYDIDILKEEIK
jgi:hypothetical protein